MTQQSNLDELVSAVLREIDDPEVGVNIVDLGLVYAASRDDAGVHVSMTTTSRSCPLGEFMVEEARRLLSKAFPEARHIDVQMVWSPAWSAERMSEAAHAQLAGGGW